VGRGVERDAGGIAGLCRLLGEHGEAIEYDLIQLGLRLDWLGTEALSWRDLLVIVRQAGPGSRLALATQGARALWSQTDYLLADVIDLLAEANWQRAGNKHAPRPKRVQRPGVTSPDEGQKFGRDPIPISEFNDWWFADDDGGDS
jgi:hypothetical protein